jgi:hypothetical protein
MPANRHIRVQRPRTTAANLEESMDWAPLVAVVFLSWLLIGLVIGPMVGHWLAFREGDTRDSK